MTAQNRQAVRRRLAVGMVGVLLLAGPAALAQVRWEIQPFIGYKWGGTVSVDPNNQLNINKVKFTSGLAYGITAGADFGSVGAEFLWNHQDSRAYGTLVGGGQYPTRVNANLNQYQGNLIVDFVPPFYSVRPFFLVGLGATNIGALDSSISKFSWAIGGGVKYFFNDRNGVRAQIRYAPTYLYSTAGGFWCNWWGFCYQLTNDHYLNQGDVTVGYIYRF